MSGEQRRAVRAELWTRAFIVFCVVMLTASLSALIYLAVQNRHTLQRVNDCTQPTGKCYRDGQKRTERAVSDIGAGNILAVVCALQVPDDTPFDVALRRVSECVADELAKR